MQNAIIRQLQALKDGVIRDLNFRNTTGQLLPCSPRSVPDLDGEGPGAQAWWEAPCSDT